MLTNVKLPIVFLSKFESHWRLIYVVNFLVIGVRKKAKIRN